LGLEGRDPGFEEVKEGDQPVERGPELGKQNGIEAGRWLLQRPGLRIHKTRCADGLAALRAYRRGWDPDKKAFGKNPLHDWSSNGSDAWRYLGAAAKVVARLVEGERPATSASRTVAVAPNTLGEPWEKAAKSGRGERI